MAKYLSSTKYSELVQALLTGSADEDDQENAIKITLGELADIWPESIRRDRKIEIISLSI